MIFCTHISSFKYGNNTRIESIYFKKGLTVIMNCYAKLPEGYTEAFTLNMQKNKKTALIINLAAVVLMAVMVVIGLQICPLSELFSFDDGTVTYWIRLISLLVGYIVYIILHELVHGITMKHYGSKQVKYGFTGMYAYAGSQDYFTKKPYIVIALAPVVVWGIVLLILNFIVPMSWFWVVYFIQMGNVSGAAGDLYVTWKFSKLPKDILVKDTGVEMTVYSKE